MTHVRKIYRKKILRQNRLQDYIVNNAQTYKYKHRYNIHKHKNTNTDITMIQWQNNSFKGDIHKKNFTIKNRLRDFIVCTAQMYQ